VRRNVVVGVLAAVLVAAALADAVVANRRAARAEEQIRQEKAARRAAELARQGEMRRTAAQVEALKQRMHALAVDAGVSGRMESKVRSQDAEAPLEPVVLPRLEVPPAPGWKAKHAYGWTAR
jgi:NAD(P)-dependent dehydrogenase (short-subunit alcohol dehydrogenase family)